MTFSRELIDRLNGAMATASAAVAEAALAAVAQDRKVTVRAFADALRNAAPMLGTAQAVLAAAIKAAKEKDATAVEVAEAMAQAAADRAAAARKARARASKKADKSAEVKALTNVENTLAGLAGRPKSDLLIEIEEQRGKVASLVADLKIAREQLADLEARYLIEQKAALKSA